jgi:hypothetical protein
LGCTPASTQTRDAEQAEQATCDGGPSTAPGHISWIVTFTAAQLIAQQSTQAAQLVHAYFDDACTFLVVRPDNIDAAKAMLPKATLTQGFTDYTNDLAPTLARGGILSGVRAIYYDSENWPFTPPVEQQQPAKYYALAAEAVHDKGYQFLAVPATDLVNVLEPNEDQDTDYDDFIELNLAGDTAKTADVYEVQSQGSERALGVFTPFVQQAAMQARDANRPVRLLAGLSTNPSSGDPTADELLAAVLATLGTVEGYWLNVPAPGPDCPKCHPQRPDLAAALLALLNRRC